MVAHEYEKIVSLASQKLLLDLERIGIVCGSCDSHFDRLAEFYDHECKELGRLSAMLYDVDHASTNNEKKRTLEAFVKRAISKGPGFEVTGEDVRGPDNEIDLKVANEGKHPFLRTLGTPIIVECRNTAGPVEAKSIRDFGGKLIGESVNTGLLVARKGVTGKEGRDALEAIRTLRLAQKVNILVFDDTDLVLLANGKKVIDLLRMEFYGKPRVLPKGVGLTKRRNELPAKLFG